MRNIRLSFKDAQLLLMRFLSLQCHLSRTGIAIVLRWAATPIPDLCFIDSTLRIGVVLDVALKGVRACEFLQFLRRYVCHRRSFRAANQRVAYKVDVSRPVQFHMLSAHDLSFEAGWVPPPFLSVS